MSAIRSCGDSAGCHLDRRVTSAQSEGPGRLEARGVGMGEALRGIDLVAEPGSVIAVVGPNGSGKSTRLTLLAGLVEPGRGSVLLDSVDVRPLDERDLRKAIGPDLPLLRGTIADNVRNGDPRADDVAAVLAAGGSASSSRPCPTDSTPGSASAGADSRPVSANASPSPGPCSPVPGCCCSTRPTPTSTRSPPAPSTRGRTGAAR